MRLTLLVLTATFLCGAASAQSPEASPSTAATSSEQDIPQAPNLNLPVSLDKIRGALAQAPVETLKGLDERPHFRIEIQEKQRFQELVDALKFDSGPAVPGGNYGYEQQQRLFPGVDNPRLQPYAAYTQGELVQVLFTSFLERLLAGRVLSSLTSAERAHAEAEARKEVERALADFWASQPSAAAAPPPKQ